MTSSSLWSLRVLGCACLEHPDGRTLALDRKTAAVLTYLAVQGPAPRSRVAGALWPQSREHTARNNLVQLLRKLRLTVGGDLVISGDVLRISDNLRVDAVEQQADFTQGRHVAVVEGFAALLGTLRFDDCPDFDEWLRGEWSRRHDWLRSALMTLSDPSISTGTHDEALSWAQMLLTHVPTSEDAYVRVMTLQYLTGRPDLAEDTFHACERALQDAFGVAPLPSTVALARTIAAGASLTTPRAPHTALPIGTLRPPVLYGREREWALMEQAWANGQGVVLSGDPGVGKSRLLQEFAASKGVWADLGGRPGDMSIPYATYARCWRVILDSLPDLVIPEWVRQEFARIVPSLSPNTPADMTTAQDKQRFLDATAEMARLLSGRVDVVIADDMQFYDPASMELGVSIASTFVPFNQHDGAVPMLAAHRRGTLSAEVEAQLRGMVSAGLGVWIDLEPLGEDEAATLLRSLDVPIPSAQETQLVQLSGGNPLFLLETVKHLLEAQGAVDGPAPVTLPHKVHALINERLKRLSPRALYVAQTAAILQSGFTAELVAGALNASIMQLIPVWDELERAQVFTNARFTHDLMYESVRASMTPSVQQALHRSVAQVLERHDDNPARIAQHWLDGGEPTQAAPWFRRAADAAVRSLQYGEAAGYLELAATHLESRGELRDAFDLTAHLLDRVLPHLHSADQRDRAIRRLARLARTPQQRQLTSNFAVMAGLGDWPGQVVVGSS